MESWTQKGISTLASSPGRHIIMDAITTKSFHLDIERFSYARVLVEVNANKGCQDKIKIHYVDKEKIKQRTRTVQVEYPWKPISCNHCKVFGHSLLQCSVRPQTETEIKAKTTGRTNEVDKDGFVNVKAKKNVNNDGNIEVDKDGFVNVKAQKNVNNGGNIGRKMSAKIKYQRVNKEKPTEVQDKGNDQGRKLGKNVAT
ncbi:RNA-directed DNA polymerase, eukaryota, reverse transcriptase zinc-binding domain protein, partial [Tanacetum coccineum]